MYYDSEESLLAPLATLSLGKLAAFAMEEELIDTFQTEGTDVVIIQGDRRFRLPERQASTFLIGMLRGRSWHVQDPAAEPVLAAIAGEPDEKEEDTIQPRDLDATLDALLSFTREVGIIQGFRRDADDRLVHIDISACSSVFSYVDAIAYLFDCVQHEVRTMTDAA